eukprot:CAMPEP_0202021914 /NCGR_PEP_ID=MMETSP0905-20130828/48151_1 /ASSEMBLY_ACC=CAM_ASM_000554 /TAXON_ID=420261 /ORGANISM="Thalassiosira antarctica, Strain CCMP982" /LENGTH=200 /DNA_ID=CAMNT_0048583929 /DNA_START=95 /DNA_END=699 /DNA_ORIENTATION=+
MDTASLATSNTDEKIPVYDDADSTTSSLSQELSSLYEDDETAITVLCSCPPTASQLSLLSQEVVVADDDPDHFLPTFSSRKNYHAVAAACYYYYPLQYCYHHYHQKIVFYLKPSDDYSIPFALVPNAANVPKSIFSLEPLDIVRAVVESADVEDVGAGSGVYGRDHRSCEWEVDRVAARAWPVGRDDGIIVAISSVLGSA